MKWLDKIIENYSKQCAKQRKKRDKEQAEQRKKRRDEQAQQAQQRKLFLNSEICHNCMHYECWDGHLSLYGGCCLAYKGCKKHKIELDSRDCTCEDFKWKPRPIKRL